MSSDRLVIEIQIELAGGTAYTLCRALTAEAAAEVARVLLALGPDGPRKLLLEWRTIMGGD